MKAAASTPTDPALERVRAVCLSLPGTTEAGSYGHPNFRAGKRIFAAYEWIRGRPSIAFRLEPADVDMLLARPNFFATPYGRGQWVSVWADPRLNWRLVERLLTRGYQLARDGRAERRSRAVRLKADPTTCRTTGRRSPRGRAR